MFFDKRKAISLFCFEFIYMAQDPRDWQKNLVIRTHPVLQTMMP